MLTGQTKAKCSASLLSPDEQKEFSEELNQFYCRFEYSDLDKELDDVILCLQEKIENEDDVFDTNLCAKDVKSLFVKLKTRKAVGPDGISARLLKPCASLLCQVFSILFSRSLKDCCVPNLWKNSVPV